MGADAARELSAQPITEAWRRENVLAPVRLRLEGPICDLTDVSQRQNTDGGELVRKLYGHRDHERALDRVAAAYESTANFTQMRLV